MLIDESQSSVLIYRVAAMQWVYSLYTSLKIIMHIIDWRSIMNLLSTFKDIIHVINKELLSVFLISSKINIIFVLIFQLIYSARFSTNDDFIM